VNETAEEEEEHESGMEAEHGPPEVDSESENQYDDLYVFIPGDNPENNSQEPLVCPRPPHPHSHSHLCCYTASFLHLGTMLSQSFNCSSTLARQSAFRLWSQCTV